MRPAKSLAFVLMLAAGAAQAQGLPVPPEPFRPEVATDVPPCRPPAVVAMAVRNVTPGLQAFDPNAQPKRMWRKGAKFLRSLDQPIVSPSLQDPRAPVARQPLTIVAEPDVWMIDLAAGVGRHAVDKGPVFEVRAPILPAGAPPQFAALEYGCEADFVAVRAPMARKTIRWGGVNAGIHIYAVGTHSVAILMDDLRGVPFMITYVRDEKPVLVLRYDTYQRAAPEPPGLFAPPEGVTISESPETPPKKR